MFNGLPVIGTDVEGINNIIKNRKNGLLVNKEFPGNLTVTIKELVNNKELATGLGQMAKITHLEKYDFSTVVDRLTGIYNEFL